MYRIKWEKKYTMISLYACIVITVALAGFLVGVNIKKTTEYIRIFISIISPILYGLIIAYFCNPLMKLCEKYIFSPLLRKKKKGMNVKRRRIYSIILTYFIVIIIFTLFALLVVPQIIASSNDLQSKLSLYIASAEEWANDFIKNFSLFNGEYETITEFLDVNGVIERIKEFISNSYELIQTVISYIVNYGGKFVITLMRTFLGFVLSFYFLYSKEKILAYIMKIMEATLSRQRIDRVLDLARYTNRTFGRYILGQMFDSCLVGIITFIVLAIFKIPYYPLVSFIVGVTNAIPYFGPYLGAIPSAFIIFIADPVKAFWFLIIILIIQQIDGNIICPRIIGDTTGLSSIWVIIAIILMGGLLGIPGMFFGVPLFALIYKLFKDFIEGKLKKKNLPLETSDYYDEKAF
ncbi:MAG: AI-2E family transporter [Clostridiales bacterium]|nr:AI-2E family transporter [Clostridiales bacterium]